MAPTERQTLEQTATQLKADGYNSSVVARKMIEQHGMSEGDALHLVGRLYGKKVSARTGDTTFEVATGVGISALGAVGVVVVLSLDVVSITLLLLALGFVGAGLTRAFIALVNAGSKEDLS